MVALMFVSKSVELSKNTKENIVLCILQEKRMKKTMFVRANKTEREKKMHAYLY
jgi:hypothetical protein